MVLGPEGMLPMWLGLMVLRPMGVGPKQQEFVPQRAPGKVSALAQPASLHK
jgi:hypothetical protein